MSQYQRENEHGDLEFSDGECWFDERHVCNRCREQCEAEDKPFQFADERYSFGYYAGRYCDDCWKDSGYRDATDPDAEFDESYAGESLHGEDDSFGHDW